MTASPIGCLHAVPGRLAPAGVGLNGPICNSGRHRPSIGGGKGSAGAQGWHYTRVMPGISIPFPSSWCCSAYVMAYSCNCEFGVAGPAKARHVGAIASRLMQ
jgi:hypothetical protein